MRRLYEVTYFKKVGTFSAMLDFDVVEPDDNAIISMVSNKCLIDYDRAEVKLIAEKETPSEAIAS